MTSDEHATLRRLRDAGHGIGRIAAVMGRGKDAVRVEILRLGMSTGGAQSAWTEERIERLKSLWAAGCTAGQIAERLGGLTRNAVIGKLHRLGLQRREPPKPSKPRVDGTKRRIRRFSARPQVAPFAGARIETPAPPDVRGEGVAAPMKAKPKLLPALRDGDCRWPTWGNDDPPDKFYCAASVDPGRPYCAYHGDRAYAGPRVRQAREAA